MTFRSEGGHVQPMSTVNDWNPGKIRQMWVYFTAFFWIKVNWSLVVGQFWQRSSYLCSRNLFIFLQRNYLQSGNGGGNKLPEIHWNANLRQRPWTWDFEEWGTHTRLLYNVSSVRLHNVRLCKGFICLSPLLQIAVLRGENAVAKTLQSAVETLEKDKAQLQSRVNSLEQRLVGMQATEGEDLGAPPSGEATTIRAFALFWRYLFMSTCFLIRFCRRCSSGSVEGREGVRWGTSKNVKLLHKIYFIKSDHVQGCQFLSVSWLSPSDQLPEQCDCGPAAEERGAEDQTEETCSGWVQRQRRDWWVRTI